MKKLISVLVFAGIFFKVYFPLRAQYLMEYDYTRYYTRITDSAYNYKFDLNLNDWRWESITYNYYNKEFIFIDSTITVDLNGIPLSRGTSFYDITGIKTEGFAYVFSDGQWIYYQHHTYFYNDLLQLSERIVERWDGNQWVNLNRFKYFYDFQGNWVSYYRDRWLNNSWTPFSVDTLIYDQLNRVVERTVWNIPQKRYMNRYLYNYNSGQRIRVRQDFIGDEWVNIARETKIYDNCGNHIQTINEIWIDNNWVYDNKTIYFFHFEFNNISKRSKVPVCHNGNTIWIAVEALQAHLNHGDCIGQCVNEKENKWNESRRGSEDQKNIPFTIYPNPAKDMVTVMFNNNIDDSQFSRIELTDYYGKLLRSYNLKDNEQLVIYRDGLLSGSYYVKLSGKGQTYTQVLIFE